MKLSNTFSRTGQIGLLIVANIFCLAAPALAADAEVSAVGGVLAMNGGVGAHGLYGGTAGFRFGHMTIFGEGNFSQLVSLSYQTVSDGTTISASGSANLASYGGGVDFSMGGSKRIVPYVVAAAGVGHFYSTGSASGGGVSTSVSMSIANDAYFGFGGGARVFLGKKWGIKPEFRYQRYDGSLLQANSFTSTVGLFWRFGE